MTPQLPREQSGSCLMRRVLYSIPYLLLAYVFSAGPLYWRIHAAYCVRGGSSFLYYFYLPLVWANELEYVRNFFDWYLDFWV